ncbi:MAG: hypothetical protein ACYDHG_17165 [Desulfomonilaceae bacterium]
MDLQTIGVGTAGYTRPKRVRLARGFMAITPLYVGHRSGPKGNVFRGHVISNEERNLFYRWLCTLPTIQINSGWGRSLVAALARDDRMPPHPWRSHGLMNVGPQKRPKGECIQE